MAGSPWGGRGGHRDGWGKTREPWEESSLALSSGRRESQVQDQGVCEAGAGRQAEGCV